MLSLYEKKVYGDGIFARYTNDTAIRVYLWSKAGFEIPGISKEVQKKLVEHVMSDPDLLAFAESLSKIHIIVPLFKQI